MARQRREGLFEHGHHRLRIVAARDLFEDVAVDLDSSSPPSALSVAAAMVCSSGWAARVGAVHQDLRRAAELEEPSATIFKPFGQEQAALVARSLPQMQGP